MKKKTILSSILVIVLCIGLISGSTYALFTSEDSVNIAITSGKVNVTAAIKDLTLYSATANKTGLTTEELADEAGTLTGTFAGTYYYDKLTGTTFTNGGTATLSTDTKTLTLDKVTPGDKVKLTVDITNNSNVAIQYRIRVNALDTGINSANSYKLFKGLSVLIGSAATDLNSTIRISDWTSLAGNTAIDDIPVEIALPLEAGNEYQELTTKIQITVEAVQGNGNTAKLKAINAILSASSTKNNTMYDAIQEVVAGGTYTYDDLKGYVWSVDNDLFYAEEDVEESFEYRFFKVYAAMPSTQTYSIYADTTWATAAVTGLTVGFDAGETSNITSVTYDRSTATDERDDVIRTNSSGTAVTINAPLDVVNHYGTAGTMNIIAVANQSHHEYGSVGFLEIKTGHVSLEKDSDVSKIHFDATVVSTTDKVFNNIIVSYDSSLSSSLPSFSRDDVAIPESGKLVVELQKVETSQTATSTTSDFIWLTKQGIFEQIKVSDNNESIENAKWADDSEVVPQTQTAAKEIANNIGRDTTTNEIKVELPVTNGSETKTYKVALDANRDLIVVDTVDTSTPVATINDSGNVTINSVDYKVELSADSNKTELKVTNTTDSTDVHSADAVTSSGLTEAEKQSAQDSITNAVAKIGAAYYATLQAAFDATNNNDTVIVLKNIDLGTQSSTPLNTKAETTFTLDLNGFVVSASVNGTGPRVLTNNGMMTLIDSSAQKNGAISNTSTETNDCTRTIENAVNATLTIQGAKVLSNNGQVIISHGSLTLNDGAVLKTIGNYSGNYSNGAVVIDLRATGELTVNEGASLYTENGMILYAFAGSQTTVNGGDFHCLPSRGLFGGPGANSVLLTGGTYNYDPELFKASGYGVVESDGVYSIIEAEPQNVSVNSLEALKAAIANATAAYPAVITLTDSIEIAETINMNKDVSLIINQGVTVSISDNGLVIHKNEIVNNGTITVTGSGFLSNPLSVSGNLPTGYIEPDNEGNYTISTPMDLQWLAVINSNGVNVLNVTLNNDITLPENVLFQQIPGFVGTFDGNNKSISGIVIDSATDYTGIFRYISYTTIKDLTINETVTSLSGTTGGIVGFINEETFFENVTLNGSITVSGSTYGTAGFVGNVYGTDANKNIHFVNCTNNAAISAPNGSIVGAYYGTATGNKSPMYVINCTNNGDVTSGGYAGSVGGFMSYQSTGKTYVYGHTNTGTLMSGSTEVTTVLGADGYGIVYDSNAYTCVAGENGAYTITAK